jgi:hypothetical protein
VTDRYRRLNDEKDFARQRRMIPAAAARTAERVHGIGARRKPGRHGPEQHPRKQREAGCEREDQRRRTRVDRQECGAREGEGEQETRGAHRDEQAGDPSADRQQNALHERLRHDLPARSADPQQALYAVREEIGDCRRCKHANGRTEMRRTRPHTPRRIWRLRLYCSFMMPTPAPAGTTVMTCRGRFWMTSGIQFAGYPESCCIH